MAGPSPAASADRNFHLVNVLLDLTLVAFAAPDGSRVPSGPSAIAGIAAGTASSVGVGAYPPLSPPSKTICATSEVSILSGAGYSSLRWFTRKNTALPSAPILPLSTFGSLTSHSTESMTLYARAVASAILTTL